MNVICRLVGSMPGDSPSDFTGCCTHSALLSLPCRLLLPTCQKYKIVSYNCDVLSSIRTNLQQPQETICSAGDDDESPTCHDTGC